jgi:hypothetical protein
LNTPLDLATDADLAPAPAPAPAPALAPALDLLVVFRSITYAPAPGRKFVLK